MKYFYLLIIPIVLSCSSTKKAIVEAPPVSPEWVQQKPIENFYYSGIGMAVKSGNNYQAIAKNNALNDLASEISVQINSTSILYQVESNEQFREDFRANTRLSSIENIEGFELVDSFENGREFWVYYRLSKSEYQALKKAKEEQAIARALDFYSKAKEFKLNNQYDDALIYSVKAIEAIKDYLGEGLKIDMDGQDIYLGNELFSFISETVNDINIRPVLGDFEITRGRVPDPTQLTFSVSTEEFSSLTDIPVYFYYSGHRIKNNEHFSDHNGMVSYPLGKITSKNPREYLQANLNLVGLSKEATEDPFVSKLVAKISGADARVNLTVKKPLIYIKSSELNFDDTLSSNVLANTFKKEFLESSFSVTNNMDNADYLLDLSANTNKISSSGGFYSASLNANIKFYDNQLNLLYTYQINNLKGVQLDYSKAGKDAYQKASEQIEKLIFRQLRRKVFD
jgi:hypothetical protein